jgi:hypothetical protein
MNGLTCEQFEQVAEEFSLGVLPGFERAQAMAHMELCPGCRSRVARLTSTRDRLLELVPEAEPPAGFERLVIDRLPRVALRIPRWAPAAAALLAIALVSGGWLLGRATAPEPVAAPPAAVAAPAITVAPLTADGHPVGQAFAYPGQPSFIYVSLNTQIVEQTGPISCSLERPDGSSVPLGTFEVRRGYGHWGASAQLEGDSLRAARLILWDAAGKPIASAQFT